MEWNEVLTLAGVFIGATVAAYVGYFRKAAPAPDKHIELAGALVDADAVKKLASVIEAYATDRRADDEKGRQIGYRLIENIGSLVDELSDLRREISDLAKEVARGK